MKPLQDARALALALFAWWGARLACVVVDLRVVERDQLARRSR